MFAEVDKQLEYTVQFSEPTFFKLSLQKRSTTTRIVKALRELADSIERI